LALLLLPLLSLLASVLHCHCPALVLQDQTHNVLGRERTAARQRGLLLLLHAWGRAVLQVQQGQSQEG
jgi:hypothetical protein